MPHEGAHVLSGTAESRATAVVRRTAELLASSAPIDHLFPRFAEELGALFGASAINLALGPDPEDLLLYKDEVAVTPAADLTRVETALRGQVVASPRAIAVPLSYDGGTVGALGIRAGEGTSYDDEDVDVLRACALYVAVRVHEQRLRDERDRLAVLAGTDPLTGIANRRSFDDRLAAEWRRAVREETNLAAIMIDVDLFKSFNDRYGHVVGDICLKRVAAALRETVRRPGDLVARVGGEEFCALLPATDLIGATTMADAVRLNMVAQGIPHDDNARGIVTISCGVAAYRPQAGDEDETRLIRAADAGLYRAKAAGRDHVATGTAD